MLTPEEKKRREKEALKEKKEKIAAKQKEKLEKEKAAIKEREKAKREKAVNREKERAKAEKTALKEKYKGTVADTKQETTVIPAVTDEPKSENMKIIVDGNATIFTTLPDKDEVLLVNDKNDTKTESQEPEHSDIAVDVKKIEISEESGNLFGETSIVKEQAKEPDVRPIDEPVSKIEEKPGRKLLSYEPEKYPETVRENPVSVQNVSMRPF